LASDQGNASERVRLHAFTDLDRASDIHAYFTALEAFDALKEIQELKAAGLSIGFEAGDAEQLPYPDASFDVARAERLLLYLPDPERGLREMRRVTKPGGAVSAIEPDFSTNAINLQNRTLVRRVLDHECDANIPHGWLVRDMRGLMEHIGLRDIRVDTRIVIFGTDLAASYFTGAAKSAQKQASSVPRRRTAGPRRSPISPSEAGCSAASAIISSRRGSRPFFPFRLTSSKSFLMSYCC
jgi:SAM-dependent methyltransferase